MDLQSIIIGLASIAPLVALALYLHSKYKQNLSMKLQAFQAVAARQGLVITEQDIWDPGYAIGLDKQSMKLLYTQKIDNQEREIVLDLNEVQQCSVSNTARDVNGGKVIDNIDLIFTLRNARHSKHTLAFYNREESLNLREELRLAEKWRDIVNVHLIQQPSQASAERKGNLSFLKPLMLRPTY